MKKTIRFTAALAIGIVLVILIAYTAIGQDGETMTLEEMVALTAETLMELQKTVARIADTAADKTEVHALETRVAALETAMPWPTATAMPRPTSTSTRRPTATATAISLSRPTPTPLPESFSRMPPAMAVIQFSQLLATDDYAANGIKFSDMSMRDQALIVRVYVDFFEKTVEVCELDPFTTYEMIQKHAQGYDKPRGRMVELQAQLEGVDDAGWRFEFIRRIGDRARARFQIGTRGCDGYLLEWFTSQ